MNNFENIQLLHKLTYAETYGGEVPALHVMCKRFVPMFHERFLVINFKVDDMKVVAHHRRLRAVRQLSSLITCYDMLVQELNPCNTPEPTECIILFLEQVERLINDTLNALKEKNPTFQKEVEDSTFKTYIENYEATKLAMLVINSGIECDIVAINKQIRNTLMLSLGQNVVQMEEDNQQTTVTNQGNGQDTQQTVVDSRNTIFENNKETRIEELI